MESEKTIAPRTSLVKAGDASYAGPATPTGIRIYRGGSVSQTPNLVWSASRHNDLPSRRCPYS